jgi:predicted ATP-binding protein involved in virulence
MFLKRIELTNIRSIEHVELSFDAPESGVRKWTFVLGENGSGKSSILRKHLTGLRDELSDLPDWNRGTAMDRHQMALLTKIEHELTDRPKAATRAGRA